MMCMNIQGTPTTKIGESRAKIKWLKEKIENKAAVILIETGQ